MGSSVSDSPPQGHRFQWRNFHLLHERRVQYVEHRILAQYPQQRPRSEDAERLPFSQHQQPGQCIDVAADQHHARDRRLAPVVARPKVRRLQNLLTKVRGCTDHNPVGTVAGGCHACLSRGSDAFIPGTSQIAQPASASPLRKPATGCRTKYDSSRFGRPVNHP
jgi:hypothetical protein